MSLQAGGNREGLNFQQVRSIALALPPLAEQIEIAKTVSSIETSIRSLNRKFSDLADLKKAMMQDLLTGKVRVKLDSPEVAAA
jgi:type I restriction enzyme S subunit